ncbi:hypothetical protein J7E71_24415 [Mesobacillus foraminis]|uniref:hypothetical protein n=1 Tax=Mesobacillus foraminis TaxID=279826 RepID=UPI001BE725A8|nr:hypothetical protein [Mesobacillus foraminis]MBT2759019.1 hypothetical protein [Mesobacillus foraminis]
MVSGVIVFGIYLMIMVTGFILNKGIDYNFIGNYGLLAGLIILIAVLPIHKIIYFGGRGIQGTHNLDLFSDESLHKKVNDLHKNEYETIIDKWRTELTISGLATILIALGLF